MKYEFEDSTVTVCANLHGEIKLVCVAKVDSEGNDVSDQEPTIVSMDNHQAFKLALEILSRVDAEDTRGGN